MTMRQRSGRTLWGAVVALILSSLVPIAAAGPHLLTGSSRFQPGSHETARRITRPIDRVLEIFDSPTASSDGFIDHLLAKDAREELFRTEAVLRLYRHKFPMLERDLTAVKSLEDEVGDYAYSVDTLKFANERFQSAPPANAQAILTRLEQQQATARDHLTQLLRSGRVAPPLIATRAEADQTFRGWGTAQDTPFVKEKLHEMLARLRDDRFDFTRLEDGIHEFRRRLRWFPLTIDGLDGLITVRDDPPGMCPAPALEHLAGTRAANHKYANPTLAHPAVSPCEISRCLLWQVSKTIRDLGRVKDDAEGDMAIEWALDKGVGPSATHKATPAETERALALRAELNSSHALDLLMSQLSSCKG